MSSQVQSDKTTSTRHEEATSTSSLPLQQQQDTLVISEPEVVIANIEPIIENTDSMFDNINSMLDDTEMMFDDIDSFIETSIGLDPIIKKIQKDFFPEDIDEGYESDVKSDTDIYLNDVTEEVDLNPQNDDTEEETESETTEFKDSPFDDVTNQGKL